MICDGSKPRVHSPAQICSYSLLLVYNLFSVFIPKALRPWVNSNVVHTLCLKLST